MRPSLLSLDATLKAASAEAVHSASSFAFSSVAIDSRTSTEGSLFIALRGSERDGYDFIPDALDQGAEVILASRTSYERQPEILKNALARFPHCSYLLTDNTLAALQKLAAAYVRQFPALIRIGITGSSGKTTTKEITAALLKERLCVVMNEGNLNSETGLPLSVFKIKKEHQAGVFEMGMNRRGEIAELAAVLFPQYGLITNIGSAHIGILGTKDAIAEEKKQIFSHFTPDCTAFIPAADAYAQFLQKDVPGKKILFAEGIHPPVSAVRHQGLLGTNFIYGDLEMSLPLTGRHNFYNALAAISIARELGESPREIQRALAGLTALPGRTQVIRRRITIIKDCYNANPESMGEALSLFESIAWKGKKILVLGDMLELGEESSQAHRRILHQAVQAHADQIILAGPLFKAAMETISDKKIQWLADACTDETAPAQTEYLKTMLSEGDLILFKASNGMGLKKLADILERAYV